jgi:hypothetical protein
MKYLEETIKQQESDCSQLRLELSEVKKQLKTQTSQDLNQMNLQIKSLSAIMKNMQLGRTSSIGEVRVPRMRRSQSSENLPSMGFNLLPVNGGNIFKSYNSHSLVLS